MKRTFARRLGWIAAAIVLTAVTPAAAQVRERVMPVQTTWSDPPAQAPAKEGLAEIPGAKLWYTDTGGPGEAVILSHAYTGSFDLWPYQQPVLAKAGYRVITYSRRGHYKSSPLTADNVGNATDDLLALMDHLKVDKAHLVGTAGGGLVPPDFALHYPERTLSVTIASSIAGISDPEFTAVHDRMRPGGARQIPRVLMELGPSYRAANEKGLAEWERREHMAWGGGNVRQPLKAPLTYATLATIKAPILLMTGDADMIMPPPRMRGIAQKAPPGTELVIVPEAGHSIYWEQPDAFNAALLDFLRRHPAK